MAEKDAKIDELTQKLGAAQGFAKAAMTNESHALKGKSLKKKNNFVDEESEEHLSGTESLSSSSFEVSEKKSKRTVSTVLTSRKEIAWSSSMLTQFRFQHHADQWMLHSC